MEATDLPRSVASSAYSAVRFLGGAVAPPLAALLWHAYGAGVPYVMAACRSRSRRVHPGRSSPARARGPQPRGCRGRRRRRARGRRRLSSCSRKAAPASAGRPFSCRATVRRCAVPLARPLAPPRGHDDRVVVRARDARRRAQSRMRPLDRREIGIQRRHLPAQTPLRRQSRVSWHPFESGRDRRARVLVDRVGFDGGEERRGTQLRLLTDQVVGEVRVEQGLRGRRTPGARARSRGTPRCCRSACRAERPSGPARAVPRRVDPSPRADRAAVRRRRARRLDTIRMPIGQHGSDERSHRMSDDDRAVDPRRIEDRDQVVRVLRQTGSPSGRRAAPRPRRSGAMSRASVSRATHDHARCDAVTPCTRSHGVPSASGCHSPTCRVPSGTATRCVRSVCVAESSRSGAVPRRGLPSLRRRCLSRRSGGRCVLDRRLGTALLVRAARCSRRRRGS